MRAFLAIPVTPPAVGDVEALCARLRGEVGGVRWAPTDSVHVTLHFFGGITADEAERALAALRPVTTAQAPIRLWLRGLGAFPAGRPPRVLWWGVAGELERVRQLAGACETALAGADFPTEDREYRPHCTLGRPRAGWPAESRRRWDLIAATEPATTPFTADAAVLFESVSTAAGVRHQPRVRLPFGG